MLISKTLEGSNITILIHDDYCCNVKTGDISKILEQIEVLISNSYCHAKPSEADVLEVSNAEKP